MSLEGKVAIVTGATAGIGAVTARLFAVRGARVVLVGRRREAGEALAVELGAGRAAFLAIDVRDGDAGRAAASFAAERFGPLDVLVNNAGIDHNRPLLEVADAEVEEVLATNVVAAFRMLRDCAAAMAGRGGSIVNVTSRLASIGVPGTGVYGASKGALLALTRHAAVELAPVGIRVNAVAPGMAATAMYEEWAAAQADPTAARGRVESAIPQGRVATPEDVAAAIAFLASDDAGHVTGASLAVDGGYTAQ